MNSRRKPQNHVPAYQFQHSREIRTHRTVVDDLAIFARSWFR